MLDDKRIAQIATEVATANLSQQNFTTIVTSSSTDSMGQGALQITIIIPTGAERRIQGDATLNTLIQIQERLGREGEDRFPIIEYSTEREQVEGDGS
jgi:hypothetical protein